MTRARWFLVWLALRIWATTRKKITICAPDGTPYLTRWFLWKGAYLHKFHQSDPDRGCHCHPWVTCYARILRGRYVQDLAPIWRDEGGLVWTLGSGQEPVIRHIFGPGDWNPLTFADFHAVKLRTKTVWTLFRYGRRHGKSWGFATCPEDFVLAKPTDGVCPGQPNWHHLEKEQGM